LQLQKDYTVLQALIQSLGLAPSDAMLQAKTLRVKQLVPATSR
jgi:hypothetical protein